MEPERITGLFEQAEARIAEFRKETYEESFRTYLEENVAVWDMIGEAGAGDMLQQEQEEAREQVADAFISGARRKMKPVKGRAKRENLQYQLNLYMVSYVLPAVIEWQKRCGRQEAETEQMMNAVCSRWEAAFGVRIQASDHESIQAGFKQKLCFVTTAVCCGLHRPQDCREIVLMKQFRDGYFTKTQEGRSLIQEYYDIAPTIVKRIAREADSAAKYQYLWNTYIKKCVDHLEKGQNEQCSRLYQLMMQELKEEYMVTAAE